jgi:protein O-mannosyl-transferase
VWLRPASLTDKIVCKSENSAAKAWIVCGLLILAVIAVFAQTLRHDFVNYDDKLYLLENRSHVAEGLTASSIGWAFRTNHGSLWGPVTWLSHLLDCHIYGFHAWGHHLTNLLLHAATTIFLFLTLRRMTGNLWPSALAAALFAIHPSHVETVAWIAERKGLLGGLFFVLTLAEYVRFVQRPFAWGNYLLMIVAFVLGLMSKPVLVTLPFLLLLLDYWPLGRIAPGCSRRLILEKLPLFVLAAAACVVAPLTQGKAVASIACVPILQRIADALVAYVAYLGQFLWPTNLVPIYLRPNHCPPIWQTLGAAAILLLISTAAIGRRKPWPWFFVGWFWFIGTLVPMIGLVPIGAHMMADRYAYVTQIGLYMIVAWGLARLVVVWPRCRSACVGISTAGVLAFMAVAWLQTSHWRNSKTLWTHVQGCCPGESIAYTCFGAALLDEGHGDKAIEYCKIALAINPSDVEALALLGNVSAGQRKYSQAADYLGRAVELDPRHVRAMHNYALALVNLGRTETAVEVLQNALAIEPDSVLVNNSLGSILANRHELDAATACFEKVLADDRTNIDAHNNLGMVLRDQGRIGAAMTHWREVIRLDPRNGLAVQRLAWAMSTYPDARIRNAREAVELAEWGVRLSEGREPIPLGTLAAAYAEAGRFSDAVNCADRAVAVADAKRQTDVAKSLRRQREEYRKDKPHRD